jgi:hypothetical protein
VATPIIFPSLSKAPTMDSGQKTFDDTIRDQMDLGYVATRPRFSRRRRTWTQNIRNLQLEDVRALDVFANETVQCGAQSFYYPNLVPNWSFEFPAEFPDEVVSGWMLGNCNLCSIAPSSNAEDGLSAIQFVTGTGSLAAGASIIGNLQATKSFQVVPGEIYQAVFWMASTSVGFTGLTANASLQIVLEMSDGSEVVVSPSAPSAVPDLGTGSAVPYAAYSQTLTIPAPSGGLTIVGAVAQLSLTLTNSGTEAIAIYSTGERSYFSISFDAIGLALLTPAPNYSIYGRLVGSSTLPFPVRFAASKSPSFSDLGFGDGIKRYGATFDLEEV